MGWRRLNRIVLRSIAVTAAVTLLRERRTRLAVLVVAVGIGGGVVGAAYLAVLELVHDVLGPQHWSTARPPRRCSSSSADRSPSSSAVLGTARRRRAARRQHPRAGGARRRPQPALADPDLAAVRRCRRSARSRRRRSSRPPARSARGSAGAAGSSRDDRAHRRPSPAWPPGSRCCSAPRSGPPCSPWRSCTAAGLEYYEALLPAVVGVPLRLRRRRRSHRRRPRTAVELPGPATLDAADLGWAVAAGVAGAVVAVVFTYAASACAPWPTGFPPAAGRRSVVWSSGCSAIAPAVRADQRRGRRSTTSRRPHVGGGAARRRRRGQAARLRAVAMVDRVAGRLHHPAVLRRLLPRPGPPVRRLPAARVGARRRR